MVEKGVAKKDGTAFSLFGTQAYFSFEEGERVLLDLEVTEFDIANPAFSARLKLVQVIF